MSKKAWQVRVHIIEARGLIGKNPSEFPDPFVQVSVRGDPKATEVLNNTSSAVWNETFFWEFSWTDEEFEKAVINIQVLARGSLIEADSLIGQKTIDVSKVYMENNHEMYKSWVGLENAEESTSTGSLLFSAGVFGEGDEPVTHDDNEDEGDADDLSASLLKNPSITYKNFKLIVRLFRAENLVKVDSISGSDTFVEINFNGRHRSKVVKATLNPTFNQELVVPAVMPNLTDNIKLTVFDHNSLTSDVLIGELQFKFSKVKADEMTPSFFHLYGDLIEQSNFQSIMNVVSSAVETAVDNTIDFIIQRPEETKRDRKPSAYRGSVLIGMSVEPTDQPVKFSQRVVQNPPTIPDEPWALWFDLYEATELGTSGLSGFFNLMEAQVEVILGQHKILSERVAIRDGIAGWYTSLPEKKVRLPSDIGQLPDIFVNVWMVHSLTGSRVRLGYCRIPPKKIQGHACDAKWWELEPDPDFRQSVAGFLLFGIGLGPTRSITEQRKRTKKPQTKKFQLRAHIYQARNLTAADKEATSDPYVIVRLAGVSQQTSVKPKQLSPRWYTTLSLVVDLPVSLALAPAVQVVVMDEDNIFHDPIGRCSIRVGKLSAPMPTSPTWKNIYNQNKQKSEGQLLLSFQLISLDQLSRYKEVSIVPKTKECIVEIQCIGVRSMLPFNFLEMEEPFLQFSIGDKNPETNKSMKYTKPSSRPKPANANFLETLAMVVAIPEDPIFCPWLDITAFDDRLTGKREVATASLWLGDKLPWASAKDLDANEVEPDSDEEEDAKKTVVHRDIPESIDDWNYDIPDDMFIKDIKTISKAEQGNTKVGKKGGKGVRTLPDVPDSQLNSDDDNSNDAEAAPKGEVLQEIIDDELDDMLQDLPFAKIPLYRGQGTNVKTVGFFKGQIRVFEVAHRNRFTPVNIKEEFRMRKCEVRVYVLRGIDLKPADPGSRSANPYLAIKVGDGEGDKSVDTAHAAEEDTLQPDFFRSFRIIAMLPGESELTVSVFHSAALGGQMIGQTKIDMENRFFSPTWKALDPMPIERPTLHKPSSKSPQGKLEMWLEILPYELAESKPMTVLKRPQADMWQLRIVIWHTFNVPMKDGSVSLFVTAEPDGHQLDETDVHRSITDGQGNFNWRMFWNLPLPDKKRAPRLKLAIWDSNLIGANEAIGEANIALKAFYAKTLKTNSRQKIKRQRITCLHPTTGDKPQGEIELEIDLLPLADAEENKVGKGRGNPNRDPFLPAPDRPGWFNFNLSWNPFGWFKRMLMFALLGVVLFLLLKYAAGL